MKNKHILYILLFLNSVIATKAQSGNEANNNEAGCVNPPAVSLNPTTICSGTSSVLTAIPTNGGITPFYTWKLNNVILPLFTNKTTLDGLGDNNVHRVLRITNNIYTATDIGLSISTNSGNTFSNKTKLANGLGNDVVLGVFVSPTKIYAATAAGLSISSDDGNTFINKTTTDGLGSNIVNDVFVDATGNTIYAATASGLSVSTNAGLSFVNKSMSNVRGILVNGNNIYAATSTGLNISTDGGANFILKTTSNGLGNNNVNDVFKVGSIIYAATSGGLSISTDGGVNFNNKTTANGLGDNNVSSVYAIGSFIYASTVGGLSMSNDGGNTFFVNKTATDGLGTNTVNDTFAEGNFIYTGTTGGLAIGSINTFQVNNATNNDVYSVTMLPSVEVCPSPNPVTTNLTISSLPAITISSNSPVCLPSTLSLTASGCAGNITWSQGGATGTILTLSTVGTYAISAICSIGNCNSNANTPVFVEIKAKPTVPIITPPSQLVVCSLNNLTLTANCTTGNVIWSDNSTGTSLTISAVGTYSISAKCTLNSCDSDASSATNLEIKAKPNAPTVTPPSQLAVCSPNNLTLTANCTTGNVIWSDNSTGTSLTISAVGTYAISAKCTLNGCDSDQSSPLISLEIKAKPSPPTIISPQNLVVCSPNTLELTASCATGNVTWSDNSTGTSLTISTVGTYSISAKCTLNGCDSDPSSTMNLEIKAKPAAPTITSPANLIVCSPSTLNLTASGCAGTITWSQGGATGTSLTISAVGTYSITAVCSANGCTSDASSSVFLEIKAKPAAQASNTGPYTVGQTIQLNATGGNNYAWSGPNNFTSNIANPLITSSLQVNSGVYTITVSNELCSAMATTNVIINGIDPCNSSRIVDYHYIKAGSTYQYLFPMTNGMIIQQIPEQVSILVLPVCQNINIESFEMNIQGPELNWNILQNVAPYVLFDNFGLNTYGRNFVPGTYTLTVTGYAQDNRIGGIVYGPVITDFTVVGTLGTISMPSIPSQNLCAGSSIDVSFSTSGNFNQVNQFQVQLSDANGSFQNPVIIGTSNTIGTVTCLIPPSTPEGSNYLIRVASSTQITIGNPTMSFITINPLYGNISQTIDAGTTTKKAVRTISATNNVISPAKVSYQAGNAIMLNAGFSAGSGSVFLAKIAGCSN